ncbi:ATP-binding protein [Thalassobaculum sp. OXR-137]|uniref:sensor histidine kinase n=1 Tax=Thalassobaculum sp. OXR-137 TaxID=3100173 RepID=UPI002AC970CC|nr:ATP-binding protein [Thalassobaculum sp. OXR-137]WPZ32542.1 ATP-binding protein [Thalassobaculum sp. OXR-137]
MTSFQSDAVQTFLFLSIAFLLVWISRTHAPGVRPGLRWMAAGFVGFAASEAGHALIADRYGLAELLPVAAGMALFAIGLLRFTRTLNTSTTTSEMLRSALDTSSDGVWLYDSNERVVFTNNRYHELNPEVPPQDQITTYTMEELLRLNQRTKDVKAEIAPESRIQEILAERRSGREIVKEVTRPNGTTYLIRAKPTRDGGLLVLQTDITALKHAQHDLLEAKSALEAANRDLERNVRDRTQELRRALLQAEMANRSKTDFLANMSHELRTPLNSIIGFAGMISQRVYGPVGDDRYLECARYVHESGMHLLELINEVLDVARIEAGQLTIAPQYVGVGDVFRECAAMLTPRASSKDIALTFEAAPDTPPAFADSLRIKQIVLNLAENAIKFTPNGGSVAVSSEATNEGGVRITIRDTGIGMTAPEVERALERFGQVGSGHMVSREGVGLGLAICKSLMELHGGTLGIDSAPDAGTTVTIVFPPRPA